jgi:hypothetical protein
VAVLRGCGPPLFEVDFVAPARSSDFARNHFDAVDARRLGDELKRLCALRALALIDFRQALVAGAAEPHHYVNATLLEIEAQEITGGQREGVSMRFEAGQFTRERFARFQRGRIVLRIGRSAARRQREKTVMKANEKQGDSRSYLFV